MKHTEEDEAKKRLAIRIDATLAEIRAIVFGQKTRVGLVDGRKAIRDWAPASVLRGLAMRLDVANTRARAAVHQSGAYCEGCGGSRTVRLVGRNGGPGVCDSAFHGTGTFFAGRRNA